MKMAEWITIITMFAGAIAALWGVVSHYIKRLEDRLDKSEADNEILEARADECEADRGKLNKIVDVLLSRLHLTREDIEDLSK